MSEPGDDPGKSDLDSRVAQAERRQAVRSGSADPGIGIAARAGTEFVAAIVVSTGVGVLVDRWLHSAPIMLLIMLVLGFGAGLMNLYRTLYGMPSGGPFKSRKANDDDDNDG